MKLPHHENAVIDLRKLEEYCLDSRHPRGKHKVKVFKAAIELTQDDAEEFEAEIRKRIQIENCHEGEVDQYGKRYFVDFSWERRGKRAQIRTTWIIKTNERFPRFTTCYVL